MDAGKPQRTGPSAGTILRDPVHLVSFGLGTGLLPRAPGTWASAATAFAWWLLPTPGLAVHLALVVGLLLAGVWFCGESERRLGRKDHPGIVLDEIVGMLATLLVVPDTPGWILAALLAFRVMDISKPWPIREIDHRSPGGWGIMLDDVLAAVYAALALIGLQYLLTLMA
ncbi:MAG: phosphatidylglycerophosphatase A [Chromatiales bacterium]|nr:phosphatidylglycerophosphatase A [Chromatiales bacterium]